MPGDEPGTPNGHRPRWLTVEDIAAELRVNYRTALKMIQSGQIKAVNIGLGKGRANWRVHRKDLDALRNSGSEAPPRGVH